MLKDNSLVRLLDKVETPYYTTGIEGSSQGDGTSLKQQPRNCQFHEQRLKNETTEHREDRFLQDSVILPGFTDRKAYSVK